MVKVCWSQQTKVTENPVSSPFETTNSVDHNKSCWSHLTENPDMSRPKALMVTPNWQIRVKHDIRLSKWKSNPVKIKQEDCKNCFSSINNIAPIFSYGPPHWPADHIVFYRKKLYLKICSKRESSAVVRYCIISPNVSGFGKLLG